MTRDEPEIALRARALETLGYKVEVALAAGNGVTFNDPSLEPVAVAAVHAQLGKEWLVAIPKASTRAAAWC